jgi:signal transduction histidine kinase
MPVPRTGEDVPAQPPAPALEIGGDRRPALDQFLHDLSTSLVAVSPSEVDHAIQRRLGELVGLLEVDCACVSLALPDGTGSRVTHDHGLDAESPALASALRDVLATSVREGRVVRAERFSATGAPHMAAPPGAAGAALASCLVLPFDVEGVPRGALAIGCARERRWPDDLVAALTFVAHAFGGAIARARSQQALEEQIVFERLVTDFVTALVSVPADLVVERLEQGLGRLISHFGVDRSALGRFAEDGSLVRVCAAGAPGVSSMEPKLDLPWFVEELRQGRVVRIDDVSSGLPAGATTERDYVAQAGIRSQLTIPLVAGDRVWGGIGFAAVTHARTWTDEEAQRLHLLGEIMMQAFLRAQTDRDQRRHGDELAHVARVAALGELAAALAHELNQPLMAIRVNAQATRRVLRAGQRPDLNEVLGDIAADATRAGDLIRRLRELLRRREPAKERLEVDEMIAGVLVIARTEAHRYGAELVTEMGAGLPPVLGDAVQLQQVVLNLVRNAAEAMSGQAGTRQIMIRTWAGPIEQVIVSVEDQGRPIDDATLGGMFTPFSSTKPGGLGIGLAISRSIVEAHAGRLWAERRTVGGLAIRFTMPAHPEARP